MDSEKRNCQNCKKEFTIESEDFDFYKNINVPAPTWCSKCRLMRRIMSRNQSALYKRQCDYCKKDVISTYSPEQKLSTYCLNCYWSDKWDPLSYGREYDFEKPLFTQLNQLFREVPRSAVNNRNAINSDYCEDSTDVKNCYLLFGGFIAEDSAYSYRLVASKNAYNSSFIYKSDHTHDCADCNGVYQLSHSRYVDESLDSAFLYDCKGCTDCFGGINLRNKKYYFFNKPYSKNDYKRERAKWDLGSYKRTIEAQEKFYELYRKTPRRYAMMNHAVNAVGDNIMHAKNVYECFALRDGVENCKYMFFGGLGVRDSYDSFAGGTKSELLYEVCGALNSQRVFFSSVTHNSHDIAYSYKSYDSSYLFGCSGMRSKKYCILNRQYSKHEYETLLPKIIEQARSVPYVDKMGRKYYYGEFFVPELFPFAYNESWAYEYFPKTENEVRESGFNWYKSSHKDYIVTIHAEDLPDHIKDVPETITKEIVGCLHAKSCNENCIGAFRVTSQELKFYKAMNVALPRLCQNCRHLQQLHRWNNELQLWDSQCGCAENKHSHGASTCTNKFKTTFSPTSKQVVYCEECYQQEVI